MGNITELNNKIFGGKIVSEKICIPLRTQKEIDKLDGK